MPSIMGRSEQRRHKRHRVIVSNFYVIHLFVVTSKLSHPHLPITRDIYLSVRFSTFHAPAGSLSYSNRTVYTLWDTYPLRKFRLLQLCDKSILRLRRHAKLSDCSLFMFEKLYLHNKYNHIHQTFSTFLYLVTWPFALITCLICLGRDWYKLEMHTLEMEYQIYVAARTRSTLEWMVCNSKSNRILINL